MLYLQRTYDGYVVHRTVEIDTSFTVQWRLFVMLLVADFVVLRIRSFRIRYSPCISTCIMLMILCSRQQRHGQAIACGVCALAFL